MCAFIKSACPLAILKLVTCISLVGINRVESNSELGVIQNFGRSRFDFFEKFLKDMLNLLSNYNERLLASYCKTLSSELSKMNFKYSTELTKHFKRLSKLNHSDLTAKMQGYRNELEKKQPHLKEFLDAMNDALPVQLSIRFSDYVLDVQEFGTKNKRAVKEETRSILDAIVNAVKGLPKREKKKLERKLKKAIAEHNSSELSQEDGSTDDDSDDDSSDDSDDDSCSEDDDDEDSL